MDDKIVYFVPGKSEPTVMYHIDPKRSANHKGWIAEGLGGQRLTTPFSAELLDPPQWYSCLVPDGIGIRTGPTLHPS